MLLACLSYSKIWRKILKTKLQKLKESKKRKRNAKIILLFFLIIATAIIIIITKNNRKNISSTVIQKENEKIGMTEAIENTEEINSGVEEIVEKDTNEMIEIEESEKESAKIKEIIEKYIAEKQLNETNFAFFYYDINTKEYYFYNENTYFTAASTIKVPIAMLYYDKINHGDINLDTKLLYKSSDYEAGTGDTSAVYKFGDYIPVSFLLEEMIKESDNTATNILKTELGGEKAYRILIKQYTKEDLAEIFNTDNVTSAKYSLDVLKRLYEDQQKYTDLINLMKESSSGGYLKKNIKDYEIAHKYGSIGGCTHDYGIVYYNDNPYLIGVFTQNIPNAENLIAEISKTIIDNK